MLTATFVFFRGARKTTNVAVNPGLGRGLAAALLAEAVRQTGEELARENGRLVDRCVELAAGEEYGAGVAQGGHRRGAGAWVEQRGLTDVATRAELGERLAAGGDADL